MYRNSAEVKSPAKPVLAEASAVMRASDQPGAASRARLLESVLASVASVP